MTTQGQTEQIQAAALRSLADRLRQAPVRINNAELCAGEPMHYYCVSCGWAIVLSEGFMCPVPQYCYECHWLKKQGWLV